MSQGVTVFICGGSKPTCRGAGPLLAARADDRIGRYAGASAASEAVMSRRCTAFHCGAQCAREVDDRGQHHGIHVSADGMVRWGTTDCAACKGPCPICDGEMSAYLKRVIATGQPCLNSRERGKLRRGEWSTEDVKSWARVRLEELEAEHAAS